MTSEQGFHKNSEGMDYLLLDIKNFLEKLETGQMEIEAGQWELHKDLANMRETIAEMRKLKEDVEEMKLNNEEAMKLIRRLKKKIEGYKTKFNEREPRIVSEGSEIDEEIYGPNDEQDDLEGFKKRRCRRIVSENLDIMSDLDSKQANKRLGLLKFQPSLKEVENNDLLPEKNALHHDQERGYSKPKRRPRKPDNVIMERYLNDAAKYHNQSSLHWLENKEPQDKDSICTSTIRPESGHGAYWDYLSGHKPMLAQKRTADDWSTDSSNQPEQKQLDSQEDFHSSKHELDRNHNHSHEKPTIKFYCKTCRKVYSRRCTLKNHTCLHFVKRESAYAKPTSYKCSYCKKTSSSPEKLTAHLKRCRIISKANIKRNEKH